MIKRHIVDRPGYKRDRMSNIRIQISSHLQDYETSNTVKLREAHMSAIKMLLRKYEYYGNR